MESSKIKGETVLRWKTASIFGLCALMFALTTGAVPGLGEKEVKMEVATFAGGCFWCMEPPFDKLEGVLSTTSGYTGGEMENPSYPDVSAGKTGHAESVQVAYDPDKISYSELLDVFWRNIDPTTRNRQFCDVGNQYRTAIFYHDEEQRNLAEASKERVQRRLGQQIFTEIAPASTFYPAEEYHQNYSEKNPWRYELYRASCGRDARLNMIWGEEAEH